MINLNDRHRLHQFLMAELAIRYLGKDFEMIQTTTCKMIFIPFIETLLTQLRAHYQCEKQYFSEQQVRLIKWQRIDAYFSTVSVTTPGEDAVFTYANQAVKTHVEEVIMNNWQALQKNHKSSPT